MKNAIKGENVGLCTKNFMCNIFFVSGCVVCVSVFFINLTSFFVGILCNLGNCLEQRELSINRKFVVCLSKTVE